MYNISSEKLLKGLTEKELLALIRKRPLPKHIAFIVDGNRLWAGKNGVSNVDGYKKGGEKVKEIILFCIKLHTPVQ